jgi:hypothetical protein
MIFVQTRLKAGRAITLCCTAKIASSNVLTMSAIVVAP